MHTQHLILYSKKMVLLALLFLFSFKYLIAQENENNNTLDFYIGYHFNKTQDFVFSPLIYQGSSFSGLGIRYERASKRALSQLSFFYDKIEISHDTHIASPVFGQRAPSESQLFDLKLAYALPLKQNEGFQWYLGGIFEAKYLATDFIFGLGVEESYLFENTLSPWFLISYQLNPSYHLQAQAHVNLISLVSRPEYSIVDNRNIQGEEGLEYLYNKAEIVLPGGGFQSYNLAIKLSRTLSSRIDVFAQYQLNYWRVDKPETLSVLKNNFGLGLSLNF